MTGSPRTMWQLKLKSDWRQTWVQLVLLSVYTTSACRAMSVTRSNCQRTTIILPVNQSILENIINNRIIISVLCFRASYINKRKHQLHATIVSVYFTAIVHSTCFGCYIHPSSGASNMYNQVWYNLITVITMGVYY